MCAILVCLSAWAHPRSRGENGCLHRLGNSPTGSSPLTRGKLFIFRLSFCCFGLIPAHAGKTLMGYRPSMRPWAHPRSRGENFFAEPLAKTGAGSSPLTRGKLMWGMPDFFRHGLIPAHAGKTPIHTRAYAYTRAHPRSRGENIDRSIISWNSSGSSPLTRGKLGGCLTSQHVDRLIPAHAGKTLKTPPTPFLTPAHPRSRGENWNDGTHPYEQTGSSPLTRGKRAKITSSPTYKGLIPAHAGKTMMQVAC